MTKNEIEALSVADLVAARQYIKEQLDIKESTLTAVGRSEFSETVADFIEDLVIKLEMITFELNNRLKL